MGNSRRLSSGQRDLPEEKPWIRREDGTTWCRVHEVVLNPGFGVFCDGCAAATKVVGPAPEPAWNTDLPDGCDSLLTHEVTLTSTASSLELLARKLTDGRTKVSGHHSPALVAAKVLSVALSYRRAAAELSGDREKRQHVRALASRLRTHKHVRR